MTRSSPALLDVSALLWRLAGTRENIRVTTPNTLPVLGDAAGLSQALEQLMSARCWALRAAPTSSGAVRVEVVGGVGPLAWVREFLHAQGGRAGVVEDGEEQIAWLEVPARPALRS